MAVGYRYSADMNATPVQELTSFHTQPRHGVL